MFAYLRVFHGFDPEKDRTQWERFREKIAGKALSQLRSENPKLLRRCLPVRYWNHLPERAVATAPATRQS